MMALTIEEIEKYIAISYEVPNHVLEVIEQPMVTIRTSTYNHGPYIKACIEGVLMQKTNFPFEFIIGEDCSTDGTRDIVMEYAEKYPKVIRVITADINVGGKVNGSRCIRASRGKYMALCEGDDYWVDENKLQKQFDILEENEQIHLCVHDASALDSDGNPSGYAFPSRKEEQHVISPKDIYRESNQFAPTASYFFRRRLIHPFPDFLYYTPIGDFFIEAITGINGVYYIPEKMSVYRRGGVAGSFSENVVNLPNYTKNYLDAMLTSLDDLESYLPVNQALFVKCKRKAVFKAYSQFYMLNKERLQSFKFWWRGIGSFSAYRQEVKLWLYFLGLPTKHIQKLILKCRAFIR